MLSFADQKLYVEVKIRTFYTGEEQQNCKHVSIIGSEFSVNCVLMSFQVINVFNIPSVSVYDRGDSDINVEFGLKIVVC